ncbi:MAG: hypothetical protein NT092_13065 [Bacteroidia bacterium]|nr:hypothetical protein [Bacteroidia bacterium]
MKKLFTLLSILILFTTGCTKDGVNGDAYISIDWEYIDSDNKVSSYTDNNPSTPVTIDADKEYLTQPGTYTYSYESEDLYYYYSHSGTYTITINPGTAKTLFSDGVDGADTYFDLYLTIYKRKGDEKGYISDARDETIKINGGYMLIHESVMIRPK